MKIVYLVDNCIECNEIFIYIYVFCNIHVSVTYHI